MFEWLKIAVRHDIVMRSIRVGAIVGTILVVINQGDALLQGGLTALNGWKVLLTYLVPYCVSTYACVATVGSNE